MPHLYLFGRHLELIPVLPEAFHTRSLTWTPNSLELDRSYITLNYYSCTVHPQRTPTTY